MTCAARSSCVLMTMRSGRLVGDGAFAQEFRVGDDGEVRFRAGLADDALDLIAGADRHQRTCRQRGPPDRIPRLPRQASAALLARPNDARDEVHVFERQDAVLMAGVFRKQLDKLWGVSAAILWPQPPP